MITGTFLAIFFIPLFFVIIVRVFGRKRSGVPEVDAVTTNAGEGD